MSHRLVQNAIPALRSQARKPLRSYSAAAHEPPISDLSASYIELEEKYGAHNYHPLPVVLSKGKGERKLCVAFIFRWFHEFTAIFWSLILGSGSLASGTKTMYEGTRVWDVDGNEYFDFLSGTLFISADLIWKERMINDTDFYHPDSCSIFCCQPGSLPPKNNWCANRSSTKDYPHITCVPQWLSWTICGIYDILLWIWSYSSHEYWRGRGWNCNQTGSKVRNDKPRRLNFTKQLSYFKSHTTFAIHQMGVRC